MRIVAHEKRVQQFRIVGADRGANARPLPPVAVRHARTFGVSAKTERSVTSIEHIEIAEDRREHRVDEAELRCRRRMDLSPALPRRARISRRPPAACLRRPQDLPVVSSPHNSLRIVEPNSIQARCCARCQRDPADAAWRRPASPRCTRRSRCSRTAPPRPCSVGTSSTGTLPSGEIFRNQSGLSARSISIRSNGIALFAQRDHRALHIGTKLVADEFQGSGHGIIL